MKYFNITIFSLLFIAIISPFKGAVSQEYTRDSLSMGPGYSNDLYYSFANGLVKEEPRSNWDIAFFTPRFSAGIMINQSSAVKLYTYPKGDTAAWATIDTNGYSTWTSLNNSTYSWEEGAFNANQKGHPDYGWCIYNGITHDLIGDSLYLVALPDGTVKKLWLINKISINNIYHFKYANIDGSEEQVVEYNLVPFESKRFAYYSLQNNAAVDREPLATDWDILFTKYMDSISDGEGGKTLYLVTGATSNVETNANYYYPVAADFSEWGVKAFSTDKNIIGADNWKKLDFMTYTYYMVDSTCYFVKNLAGDVYKLSFVSWAGTASGKFALDKMLVSLSSVNDNHAGMQDFKIFPVPATDHLTVKLNDNVIGDAQLTIYDLNGRSLLSQKISGSALNTGATIQLDLTAGLYIVKITHSQANYSQKLLVR